MNLDQRRAVLETEPATSDQVGVVVRQFERLGFTGYDRAERLALSAALLGLDALDSTKDLTKGQAGKLYRMLLGIGDRDELRAAARIADEGQADEQARRPTLADLVLRIAVYAYAARTPRP